MRCFLESVFMTLDKYQNPSLNFTDIYKQSRAGHEEPSLVQWDNIVRFHPPIFQSMQPLVDYVIASLAWQINVKRFILAIM